MTSPQPLKNDQSTWYGDWLIQTGQEKRHRKAICMKLHLPVIWDSKISTILHFLYCHLLSGVCLNFFATIISQYFSWSFNPQPSVLLLSFSSPNQISLKFWICALLYVSAPIFIQTIYGNFDTWQGDANLFEARYMKKVS